MKNQICLRIACFFSLVATIPVLQGMEHNLSSVRRRHVAQSTVPVDKETAYSTVTSFGQNQDLRISHFLGLLPPDMWSKILTYLPGNTYFFNEIARRLNLDPVIYAKIVIAFIDATQHFPLAYEIHQLIDRHFKTVLTHDIAEKYVQAFNKVYSQNPLSKFEVKEGGTQQRLRIYALNNLLHTVYVKELVDEVRQYEPYFDGERWPEEPWYYDKLQRLQAELIVLLVGSRYGIKLIDHWFDKSLIDKCYNVIHKINEKIPGSHRVKHFVECQLLGLSLSGLAHQLLHVVGVQNLWLQFLPIGSEYSSSINPLLQGLLEGNVLVLGGYSMYRFIRFWDEISDLPEPHLIIDPQVAFYSKVFSWFRTMGGVYAQELEQMKNKFMRKIEELEDIRAVVIKELRFREQHMR